MKYTVVVPYRNREQHLQILLPRLLQMFSGKEFEIVVAEQDEQGPFRKTVLMNMAVKHTNGDVLIFHDVDYYPTENVSYEYDEDVVIYPVRNVIFLNAEGKEMDDAEVPGGYRMFKYDVGNHTGGVVMISRKNFYKVNGFNPSYRGWGKEDDDFMMRIDYHKVLRRRNAQGAYLGLYHANNEPSQDDPNFRHNVDTINGFINTYWMGFANTYADVTETDSGIENVRWLKMKNCREDVKMISLTLPTRNRIDSLKRTIKSLEDGIADKSQVELIFKVDEDDEKTVEYVNTATFGFDVVRLIGKRDPAGYRNIGLWQHEMSQIARGKVIAPIGDDWTFETPHWDMHVVPYQDAFGIVYTKDDEGAPFGVSMFITMKLYRTMQWFGTHPYIDRWFDAMLKSFSILNLGQLDVIMHHNKDNPSSQDLGGVPIEPVLRGAEQQQWVDILKRIENHLKYMYGR